MTTIDSHESTDDALENEPNQDTLGSLLTAAREQRGFSIEEVATRLHLRPQIVKDIEADNFVNIASSTYVRGYVKNFARIVIADPIAINACLARQVPQVVEHEMQSFSRKTTRQARDSRWMWLTYFIALALVALVVLWWFQKSTLTTEVDYSKPTVEEVAASSQLSLESLNSNSVDSNNGAPILNETEQVANGAPVLSDEALAEGHGAIGASSTEGVAESGDANNSVSLAAPETNNQIVAVTDSSPSQSSQNQASANLPEATSNVTTSSLDLASGQRRLTLLLTGDCWINIKDATGKTLVDGVKGAQGELNIAGVAPFKVILGAPQVVTLKLDGEHVSLSEFPNGRVARLTLPAIQ